MAGRLAQLLGSLCCVRSAGLLGWRAQPASPHTVTVAAARGVELGDHRSRRLEFGDVQRADLVLAMTRQHAWGVAAHDPAAAARTFLPAELARLGRRAGPRRGLEPRAWVEALSLGRDHRRPGRATDEVSDPAGQPLAVYEGLATDLDPTVTAIASLLADAVDPRKAPSGAEVVTG